MRATAHVYRTAGHREQLLAMTDNELLARAAAGEDLAFEVLFKRYHLTLLAYVRRQVGDLDLAEEIVQEVFVRIYKHRHNFRTGASFTAWMNTIKANWVKNEFRRQHNHRHVLTFSQIEACGVDKSRALDFPDYHAGPEEITEEKEASDLFIRSLSQLPDHQREAVWHREIRHESYDEIARITRSNVGTVKSRIHRGRIALKKLMAPSL